MEDGSGKNMLGRILMQIREELQQGRGELSVTTSRTNRDEFPPLYCSSESWAP